MTGQGWAIVDQGAISVKSVAESRRGAIVNFLIVARNIAVFDWMSDDDIERLWNQYKRGAESLPVRVTTG